MESGVTRAAQRPIGLRVGAGCGGVFVAVLVMLLAACSNGRSTNGMGASSPFRTQVMADNPSAFWRLGEASGSIAADERGSSPGAYLGEVTHGAAGAISGDPSAAALLDGVNDTVRVSNTSALSPTSGLSLEAWVAPTSLASAATVIRKNRQYLLRLDPNRAVLFRLWEGGRITELSTAGGALVVGSWSHLVATFDGSTMTIYVNGTPRANRSLTGPIDPGTTNLFLGSSLNSYDYLPGGLDEVAVYPDALSSARVRAHYRTGIASDTTAPAVTLTQPADGSSIASSKPTFSGSAGTASGDAPTVTVKLYSGSNASGTPVQTLSTIHRTGGRYTVPASFPLSSGTYSVRTQQQDIAGNTGLSSTTAFTITTPSTGLCGFRTRPPSTYSHVIVIMMENKAYRQIIGNNAAAPYENQLASGCGLATNYHGITHPSLPNYVAATSGSTQGITDDSGPADHPLSVPSIFSQVATWRTYAESMPFNCDLDDAYPYTARHNPATYFAPSAPACANWNVPMGTTSGGNFQDDLGNGTLPQYAWITPNVCNDTHDCTIAVGDAWLHAWVTTIVASAAYQSGNTVLIVTWDENDSGAGNHIATIVVSPYTHPGTRSGILFDHYSLLRTTEELLGITSYLGNAATARSMRGAFGL